MTQSINNARDDYQGDGAATVLAYTFRILNQAHVKVDVITDATGVTVTKTITTDYTVSGVGDSGGGNVTFLVAPLSTETIVVTRNIPVDQLVNYQENGPFPAEITESTLDKLTQINQQQDEDIRRCVRIPLDKDITDAIVPVGFVAKDVFRVNATKTGIEAVDAGTALSSGLSDLGAVTPQNLDKVILLDISDSDELKTATALSIAELVSGGGGPGGPAVESGSGVPSSTPATIGDIYVDTTNSTGWVAVGTSSSADWQENFPESRFPTGRGIQVKQSDTYPMTLVSRVMANTDGGLTWIQEDGISGNPTIDLSFDGLTTEATIDTANDIIAFYDDSASVMRKATFDDFITGTTGTLVSTQVFTASGTWTRPAGVTSVFVIVLGGGGGGGGAASTSASQGAAGSGGGAGGEAREYIAAPGATETITIGAAGTGGSGNTVGVTGGTSSFGAHCSATGGIGGNGAPAGGVQTGVEGVRGGTGSGGDINLTGSSSDTAMHDGNVAWSGTGASSPFGGGGPGRVTNTQRVGANSLGFGSGGSGCANGNSQASGAGGTATPGLIFVLEYS